MPTRLFFDTNVMLDLLGERIPHYYAAAKIATLADEGQVNMIVSALSYGTTYYILSKFESSENVLDKLQKFKIISEISDLNEVVIQKGLTANFSDFEDSLQYYCAIKSSSDILITRNTRDFKESDIPVMTPEEYLKSIRVK